MLPYDEWIGKKYLGQNQVDIRWADSNDDKAKLIYPSWQIQRHQQQDNSKVLFY